MSGPLRLDEATIDAIAQRVANRLLAANPEAPAGLIDAAEVARRHGVTRSWVYEHAERLGAVRLGSGARARLRFDPARVAAVLAATPTASPQPLIAARPRRRPDRTSAGAPLLPIDDKRKAA